jgi:hypothetical protein
MNKSALKDWIVLVGCLLVLVGIMVATYRGDDTDDVRRGWDNWVYSFNYYMSGAARNRAHGLYAVDGNIRGGGEH